MPFTSYTRMTRDDALAIRAYLATIPPERHAVQANQLPFPFSIRTSMIAWDALFFREGAFQPLDGKSPEWNRGAYLVQGPEHCTACHTPKTWVGADKTAQMLQGSPVEGWWAPGLTASTHGGLGGWSAEDIAAYLKTGHNPFASAAGPMAEVVTLSTSRLTDADLRAIAVYLKDLPDTPVSPAPAATALPANDPVMVAGAAIYADECSACHKPDGSGVPNLFPDLRHLGSVESTGTDSLQRVVIRGSHSVATGTEPTGPAMPSFGWLLNDDEIAAVATYVRNGFGNAAPAVSASEVSKTRAELAKRTD